MNENQANPKVTVIMPVFNRAYMLRRVLDALLAQTYRNVEIIAVDDGSTDNTADVIRGYPSVIYLKRANAGAAAARNTGLERATGDIVHFLDSDVIAPPDLVDVHVREHMKNPRFIVQSQLIRIIDLADAGRTPYSMVHYSRSFFDGASVSVRMEHVRKAGGFDSVVLRHGWDDLEYGLRLLKTGCRPRRLAAEGAVWHYEGEYTKENIHKFFKKRRREGELGVEFYRLHPSFSTRMMVMAHPFFYWLGRRLYDEGKILSDGFTDGIRRLIDSGKKNEAIAKVRLNGYCFYLQGVEEKIRQDGFLLRKKAGRTS